MPPFAHSARPECGIPAQEYADHVRGVFSTALDRARRTASYSSRFGDILVSAVGHAGLWHDLGKLEPANQAVLGSASRARLPVNHCDAGVAHLLREATETGNPARLLAAFSVFAHHAGLPSYPLEEQRARFLRDESLGATGRPIWEETDAALEDLVRRHRQALSADQAPESTAPEWAVPVLFRLALSCLVDADHADTAFHYRNAPLFTHPPLRATERLAALAGC